MQVKQRLSLVRLAMLAFSGLAASGMIACGGGDSGPAIPPPVLTTLNVSLANASLLPGQTTTVSANGLDQNGAAIATGTITWTSSANNIATVNASGGVTAVATGSATITGTSASGRSGSAQLTVLPIPVASVTIAPAIASIIVGGAQQLVANTLDGNGGALQGRTITWTSSDPTRATVSASGLVTAVATGTTTITATSEGRSGTAAITVIPVPVAAITLSPPQASLIVGGTQQFTATTRDAAGNVLTGRAITWASSDPSRVTISASGVATGVAVGAVNITASSEGRSASVPVTVSGPQVPACDVFRPIVVGQTVNSTLSAADCRLNDGSFTQKYELRLNTQTAVQIDMTSGAVDAYLYLQDGANGTVIDENDDDGGQTNARISRLLPAGRYIIYANTFDANETGAYQLSVTQATAGCFSATPLQPPTTLNGSLTTGSCRLRDGAFANRFELNVVTAATYQITLSSAAFDAYLAVFTESGTLQGEDDDGAGGTNSRLIIALPPGKYIVLATSFGADEVGAFSLDARLYVNPCSVARPLVSGVPIVATLSTNDCVAQGGQLTQFWELNVPQQTSVRIDMTSSEIDAYLRVYNRADGSLVLDDDDSAGGTNARVVGTLPTGQYIVEATTFRPSETGQYTISLGQPVFTTVAITLTPATVSLQPGGTQNLTATVSNTTNTQVLWQSSAPNVATVSSTGQVRAVAPGNATISATAVADPIKFATSRVTVGAVSSGPVNLDISAAYATQAIQTLDSRIPLVANRRALLRVFVRASQPGITSVPVRVLLSNNGALVATLNGTAQPSQTFNEGCTSCAAEFLLTEAQVRSGLSFVAQVDPLEAVPEVNENDNSFPLNGVPQAFSVQSVPDLRVNMVPVRFNKNGRLGVPTTALLNGTRAIWPIATLTSTIASTFGTDLAPPVGDDRNGTWSELLRQMDTKRQLEGSQSYYFGVMSVDYNSGLTGLAYLSGKAGLGIDFSFGPGTNYASENMAHELGHNFSRRHTPCFTGTNVPANIDQDYPFSDGRIGVHGIDLVGTGTARYGPTAPDIMGYCNNGWASPYSWSAVSVYRAAQPNRIVLPPRQALVVPGMMKGGVVRIDPAFSAVTSPLKDDPNGTHVVEARDAGGKVIVSQRFTPLEPDHGAEDARAFVLALPLDAAQQARVASIAVRDARSVRPAAQRVRTMRSAGLRNTGGAQQITAITARTVSASEVEVAWDRDAIAAIAVRDRRTGEILSFGDAGTMRMSPRTFDTVEFLLSDGVSSVVQPSARVLRKAP